MSTPPAHSQSGAHPPRPTRAIARAALVLVAVAAVVSSTAAKAGLDPPGSETQPNAVAESPSREAPPRLESPAETSSAQLIRAEVPSPADNCSPLFPDYCVEVAVPDQAPAANTDSTTGCALSGEHAPTMNLTIVPGTAGDLDAANVVRLRVEIEEGLAIDAGCFAATAIDILTDDRGWTTVDDVSFARVDDDSYDLRIVLASPATTDTLCYPANTAERYSCRNGDKVIINLMRWESGTDDYTENLTTYRHYLLNHEVGHFLGRGHLNCQGPGEPAPVMMQQTKGLGECLPNGWPTEVEQ